ncbi:MAG TPA: CBS domain-containing protein [Egibacteraceae bacterium]|nr:CBS domain-containing protein [Egibacteraceae bacterium]
MRHEPRAAWRLESLGFRAVYDYPTCGFRDRAGTVRERLATSPFGQVVALNAAGVVMGRLVAALEGIEDSRAVEEVMREGPATVRPSEELDALVGQMRHAGVDAVVVTRSDGRLLGLLERAAAERHLDERGG